MNTQLDTPTATLTGPDIPLQAAPPAQPRFPWGLLFTVWLLVFFTATLVTFVLPERFSSTARIRIGRDRTDIPGFQASGTAAVYDPYFLQTELEVLRSETILDPVIAKLNLNQKWAAKLLGPQGGMLKTEETRQYLHNHLSLNTVRNTSLVEVTVISEDRNEARDLANAIADTYQDYRQQKRVRLMEGGIAALKNAYAQNNEQVHQFHVALTELAQSQAARDTNAVTELAQRLDGLQRFSQELLTKVAAAKADLLLPANTMVEIVEHAVASLRPVSPNKSLNIASGLLVGGLAGLFLATLVFVLQWLAYRRRGGRTGLSPQFRAAVHILITLGVGLFIGYLLAEPLDLATLIGIPFVLLLGGGVSAYVELARFHREAASGNGNTESEGL